MSNFHIFIQTIYLNIPQTINPKKYNRVISIFTYLYAPVSIIWLPKEYRHRRLIQYKCPSYLQQVVICWWMSIPCGQQNKQWFANVTRCFRGARTTSSFRKWCGLFSYLLSYKMIEKMQVKNRRKRWGRYFINMRNTNSVRNYIRQDIGELLSKISSRHHTSYFYLNGIYV